MLSVRTRRGLEAWSCWNVWSLLGESAEITQIPADYFLTSYHLSENSCLMTAPSVRLNTGYLVFCIFSFLNFLLFFLIFFLWLIHRFVGISCRYACFFVFTHLYMRHRPIILLHAMTAKPSCIERWTRFLECSPSNQHWLWLETIVYEQDNKSPCTVSLSWGGGQKWPGRNKSNVLLSAAVTSFSYTPI